MLYGDIIFDRQKGWCIFSSEKILSLLAEKFRHNFSDIKIFYCGGTDGVYDKNGVTIDRITPKLFGEISRGIGGSAAADVTGGMQHKVNEAVRMAKFFGMKTIIFNGNTAGNLKLALTGGAIKWTVVAPD